MLAETQLAWHSTKHNDVASKTEQRDLKNNAHARFPGY
jgi:hypothetical protein